MDSEYFTGYNWGGWRFYPPNSLQYHPEHNQAYEIELDWIDGPEDVVTKLLAIQEKRWGTPGAIAGLLRALDRLVSLRAHPRAEFKRARRARIRKWTKLWEDRRRPQTERNPEELVSPDAGRHVVARACWGDQWPELLS